MARAVKAGAATAMVGQALARRRLCGWRLAVRAATTRAFPSTAWFRRSRFAEDRRERLDEALPAMSANANQLAPVRASEAGPRLRLQHHLRTPPRRPRCATNGLRRQLRWRQRHCSPRQPRWPHWLTPQRRWRRSPRSSARSRRRSLRYWRRRSLHWRPRLQRLRRRLRPSCLPAGCRRPGPRQPQVSRRSRRRSKSFSTLGVLQRARLAPRWPDAYSGSALAE